ncbi:hypothetical protein CR513_13831, partial [Mucuna pruriens]
MTVYIKLLMRKNKIMLNNNQLNNMFLNKIMRQHYEDLLEAKNDPKTFLQAMSSKESNLWYNFIKDEMDSMASNQLPNGVKANIKRHKTRYVAKREVIDYIEAFSLI